MSDGRFNEAGYAGRPSVCRNCGALVGAGERNCSACGAPAGAAPAPSAAAPVPPPPSPEARRFIRAIISRPATFTFVFIVANIFVYLLMFFSGGASDGVLIAYGAKVNSLIREGGEWWRFVTPVFLHVNVPGFDPMHLLVNMYSLFMLGPYVEKLYGSARFVFFWIATGVAGVAASYFASSYQAEEGFLSRFLFRGGDGPSAGASGALFGLVGVLFVFGIKFRHELPEEFKRAFGTGMLPTILINLFIGFAVPMIDNAAHLGGLLAGALLALLVGYKRPGERAGVAHAWHAVQVACLALVVVSFFLVWRNFGGPPPTMSNARERFAQGLRGGSSSELRSYIEAVNGGVNAFGETFNGNADAAAPALEKLTRAKGPNRNADILREDLVALLTRARDLSAAPPQEKASAARQREEQRQLLAADFVAWNQRFEQWVANEGKDFGLELVETPTPAAGEGETPAPEKK
ncbi:MAG TPA: rhomboid family intramembrane serine protease [Pyrinomonadaceae bacterium]|nr:rhomboid family intramembrane serine protease [Pyrinomonadaceae bacterium]